MLMRLLKVMVLLWVGTGLFVVAYSAHASRIVVTIPPLASALKPLLGAQDQLTVLLTKGQSPHGFYLKPSHLVSLQQADIVVGVGFGVDAWAQKAMQNLRSRNDAVILNMMDVPNLTLIQADETEHEHSKAAHHHEDSRVNPHVWLDMGNVEKLVGAFSERFARMNPQRAETIRHRARQWIVQLQQADNQIRRRLQPVKQVPYLVMHNAFTYYEKRYGLNNQGALQINPEQKAGVQTMLKVHRQIEAHQIKCIFQEPQMSSKQLKVLVKGTSVKIGVLDPLGDGSQDSVTFMKRLASDYFSCLES
ncbi:MAG: zinc ABC transporter substrate-binding protein [Hydrogenovibrio sp.]|nr:zinc ABC transporter substrate-binding protein [Hydrogenovibrio sp.]